VRTIAGSTGSVALTLAYPVGDVILLALALGAVVMEPRHPARALLFASGSALMAVGAIVSLHQITPSAGQAAAPLNLLWPAGMIALTASVWIRPSQAHRSPLVEKSARVIILSVVFAACPVILVLGNVQHVNAVALGLAGDADGGRRPDGRVPAGAAGPQ